MNSTLAKRVPAVWLFFLTMQSCAGEGGGPGGEPAPEAEPDALGLPCRSDADCPESSGCVNANSLPGRVARCEDSSDASSCVTLAESGPSLGWSQGYCSPRCGSDAECTGNDLAGTCALRLNEGSLELDLRGGDLCRLPCADVEECLVGFECQPGLRCDVVSEGDDLSCVPCEAGNQAPAAWRCPARWYGGGDGCDCGCGATDADCAGPTVGSCTACDPEEGACGECSALDPLDNAKCLDGSPAWACDPSRFGDGSCDCGCGFADPDCADLSAASCVRCPDSLDGGCNASLGCPGQIDPDDNTRCLALEAWSCADDYLGDGICDCGCGAPDPDCPTRSRESCENCPFEGCSLLDFDCPLSIDADDNAVCVDPPEGFTCAPSSYGDGTCDCGCGVTDADCASTSAADCARCPTSLEGGCSEGASCPDPIDEADNALCRGEAEWSCAPVYYDGGDGICDCGCGLLDLDCADATVESCDVCHDDLDGGCNTDGLSCPGSIDPADNARCAESEG